MTIQIGKLRSWIPTGQSKPVGFITLSKGFTYPDIKTMFDNIEKDVAVKVSDKERFNLFYTVANHAEGKREFESWESQNIIPFDLDGIDLEQIDKYPPLLAKTLDFDLSKCAIIYSGNGCHVLVQVPRFTDKEYIKQAKLGYVQSLDKMIAACKEAGLPITKDTTAWDYGRVLRLPFTINIKEKDGVETIKQCRLIQNNLEDQNFQLPFIKPEKSKSMVKGSWPAADIDTILNECDFFKWLENEPEKVHEPHAYAMLSITGHFDDDNETSRRLWASFASPSISKKNVDEFTEQARKASGPRTCDGIAELWDGCQNCPHYKKVTSPIMLKHKDFIATEHMGFTTVSISGKSYVRHYEDLRKWFEREKHYVHIAGRARGEVLEFDGKKYNTLYDAHLKIIAQEKFFPVLEDDKVRIQFVSQVKSNPDRARPPEFLRDYQENLVNLNNGILNFKTGDLVPHDPKYGFTKVLDYDFEPTATCPYWDKFIHAAMRGDRQLVYIIEEMLAFTLSGMSYTKHQFYFLLIGTGFNGKSTLLSVLEKMLGEGNFTNYPLEDLISEKDARAGLAYSLANIVSDSSATALKGKDLTRLKAWTGNDSVTGRFLYQDAINFVNRAKFIFGFNSMPEIKATTKGDDRRIMAIPFNADFSAADSSFYIPKIEEKLKAERSGILNRLLAAYARLEAKGFTKHVAANNAKNQMKKHADSIYDFITDRVLFAEGKRVSFEELLDAYNSDFNYGAENFPKQQRAFTKEIRSLIHMLPGAENVTEGVFKVGASCKRGLLNAALDSHNTEKAKF